MFIDRPKCYSYGAGRCWQVIMLEEQEEAFACGIPTMVERHIMWALLACSLATNRGTAVYDIMTWMRSVIFCSVVLRFWICAGNSIVHRKTSTIKENLIFCLCECLRYQLIYFWTVSGFNESRLNVSSSTIPYSNVISHWTNIAAKPNIFSRHVRTKQIVFLLS